MILFLAVKYNAKHFFAMAPSINTFNPPYRKCTVDLTRVGFTASLSLSNFFLSFSSTNIQKKFFHRGFKHILSELLLQSQPKVRSVVECLA